MRLKRKKLLWLLGVLCTSSLLMTLCTSCLVRKVVFHPTKGMQASLNNYSKTEAVTITTEDGVHLSAFYLEDGEDSPTILFFHGNAGNASHRLDDADRLRSLGANVLLVDYRGYGLSEGKASESGVYTDAQASLDFLLEKKKQPPERIILYGRSLGSAVAVNLAQQKPLAGVVLVSPFTSGRDMAPFLLKPLAGDLFDSYGKIREMRCPLLIIHGDVDTLIPIEMGQRLYKAATVEKQFVVIKGGGHNDLIQVNPHRFFSTIGDFLKRVQ